VVGGQERHLIHEDHHERVLRAGGVLAVAPGELGGPVLHIHDSVFEHRQDGRRISRVPAVVVEDGPAVGQFHQLRVSR